MKHDPVEHTVKLKQLLAEYNDLAAKTYNPNKKKAIKLLNQITMHCSAAIDLWLNEEK